MRSRAIRDEKVIHWRGVTEVPGLYFLGLSWQHTRGSALLGFVHHDAAYLAGRIITTTKAGPPTPRRPALRPSGRHEPSPSSRQPRQTHQKHGHGLLMTDPAVVQQRKGISTCPAQTHTARQPKTAPASSSPSR